MPDLLIAYATRTNTTAELASAMADAITEAGISVEAKPISEVASLDSYRAVILGSAVRYGRWLSEATRFAKTQREALAARPLAIFSVHALNTGDDEADRAARAAYTAPLSRRLRPQAEAFFKGRLEIDALPTFEKLISKAIKAQSGDWREWEKVCAWAENVSATLLAASNGKG